MASSMNIHRIAAGEDDLTEFTTASCLRPLPGPLRPWATANSTDRGRQRSAGEVVN